MKHYGYFDQEGRLHCESFRNAVDLLRQKRAPVVLTVKQFHEGRSNQANKYYWGVVIKEISLGLLDLGWEPRECLPEGVHDLLKSEYLIEQRHLKDGILVNRVKSTTELDAKEFGDYLEHCIRWAAQNLGVTIPPPGEQMEIAA